MDMEGGRIGGYESGRENDGEKLSDDHEVLKKMISSHPLYGLLIESHFNCLKVGLGEFGEFDITDAACKQKTISEFKTATNNPSSTELDHFMEAYCMALSSLKEAMEEPTKETRAFINSMHVELKELCNPNDHNDTNNKPQDAIECSSKKNL
ncbi:homeobox protein knotted-1-like 1 [Prosopis cineraria]|uniref:homeobox protein knotted-1-like 1 n=1 Tax=Prosopis cineraria TaxID=364024 RepID=UPI00240F4721|nr:homeobox protein knotted-1-like 1 [Prosopis cineraria]